VPRDGLVRRLAAVSDDIPLIVVVAPAGYGKTTALSQWARADDRPFGWLQLDESDSDPALLLRHIAMALRGIRFDDAVWRVLAAPGGPSVGAAVQRLVAALRAHGKPAVLVLDDVHSIRRSAALDVVVTLAASLPPGCHLVAAAQRRPGLKIGRLRSQGRCIELGPADLAFATAEANALLSMAGVQLPDDAVQALVRRTEGWPAGVYLAALSLQGRSDAEAAARHIAGSNRYIVDYFWDEVLNRQSAETVRFLLRTSTLDTMCGPLCDAVLDTTGSAAWLTELQGLNLFMVPLDERGEWYRYHRLFAEMLLSELRRREPGEEYRIRRRAARWFEEHGLPEQAITHALAGQDTATAARLISRHAQRFSNEGRVTLVRSWLETLDDDDLQRHPPLAVMAAWVWAFTGDAPRAHRSLHIAESGTFDGVLPDGSASLASALARARAALAPYGIDRMLADTKRAVKLEPPGSPWHPLAAALHGTACMLTGSPGDAAKAFERAARLGREEQRPSASFALAQQSLLAADRGDWSTAETCATESRQVMEEAHLLAYPTALLTYAACARVAAHRADTQAAWADAVTALRLYQRPSPVALPWLGAQAAIVLGRILLDLGDEPAARLKATEAGRHLASLLTEGVLRERYLQLVADLDRARRRSRAKDAAHLTKAELRILRLLPTHLSLNEIAQELFISRNTVKSQVAAVYLKLNATNRTEAVEQGRTSGLLDP
jgi:LuxR family transcriptional regulator, maltose regulon positive regulatory protein